MPVNAEALVKDAFPFELYELELSQGWPEGYNGIPGSNMTPYSVEVPQADCDAERQNNMLKHAKTAQHAAALLPHAVRVQDLPEEAAVQRRFAEGLGAIVVGEAVERPSPTMEKRRKASILDRIDEAARGNADSLEQDITVTASEALTDEGVMEDVSITRDKDGRLQQFGQGLYDILENALTLHAGDHPDLHEVTRVAALDHDVLNVLDGAGYFDAGNVWIIPRIVPIGTPGRAIRGYGYFENFAVAWNFIWKTGPGEFTLRPAFTAGVESLPDEESQDGAMTEAELDAMYDTRAARRHDVDAIQRIYADLGLPVPTMTVDFLRGFIMHRGQFKDPNHPELDMLERYDQKLGPDFFLGRLRRPEDISYTDNSRKHIEALRGLQKRKQAIVQALIDRRHTFGNDAMAAAHCLAKLVEGSAVDYVYDNPQYVDILGPSLGMAAYNSLRDGGDRNDVRRKARVNTCGFGGPGQDRAEGGKESAVDEDANDDEDEDGDCEFTSEECPECHAKKVRTVVRRMLNGNKLVKGSCGCSKVYVKKTA